MGKEKLMPRIQPMEPEDASQESRQLMEQGEQTVGQMLNFFKQMAVSPAAFKAYMEFNGALQSGALDKPTHEAVYIAASNFNGCTYCLSTHSAAAEQVGLDQDEIQRVQQFESEGEGLAAALRFTRELVENRGRTSDEAWNEVREAGYTDEQILEIIATVALAAFTNYVNNSVGTEVDLPEVEPVPSS
jgi:uncharacterized peroxidase-related enzyme